MNSEEIIEKITNACIELYELKKYLIEEKAHERTIAAYIAMYLQEIFSDWDVDPDYNREGEDRRAKRDIDGKLTYPDIIIHEHGPEGNNLVAIEVKGYWNKADRKIDELKLIKLQQKHYYEFLFRIELGENEAQIIEVVNES